MKKRDLITLWILAAPVMGAVFAPAPASAGETHSRPELAEGPYRKQRSEIRRLIDQLSHPDLTPFLKPFQEIEKEIAGGKPGPTVKERITELREGIRARLRSEARLRNLYALSYSTRTLHPYCTKIETTIKNTFNKRLPTQNGRAEVIFTVDAEGNIINAHATGEKGNETGEAIVKGLSLIKSVSPPPFAPLNLFLTYSDTRICSLDYERTIDYDRYMYKVEKHLNKGIKRSGVNSEKGGSQKDCHATVSFSVENDGAPAHIKLLKSSEDKAFDDACIKAVKDAAPLPRPGKFPGDAITIRHNF